MRGEVGDRLRVHSKTTGRPHRSGTITEVRGPDGSPPYLVRFDDGDETLFYPGADCTIARDEGDPAGQPAGT